MNNAPSKRAARRAITSPVPHPASKDARAGAERVCARRSAFLRPDRFGLAARVRTIDSSAISSACGLFAFATRAVYPGTRPDCARWRCLASSTACASTPCCWASRSCWPSRRAAGRATRAAPAAEADRPASGQQQGGGTANGGGEQGGGATGGGATTPNVIFPRTGITAAEVGVLVNDDNPLSVSVADYYVKARKIPRPTSSTSTSATPPPTASPGSVHPAQDPGRRRARIGHPGDRHHLDQALHRRQHQRHRRLRPWIQDDRRHLQRPELPVRNAEPLCDEAGLDEPLHRPRLPSGDDHPRDQIEEAKAIIDKGVASDDTWPTGTAYLMEHERPESGARAAS